MLGVDNKIKAICDKINIHRHAQVTRDQEPISSGFVPTICGLEFVSLLVQVTDC